MRKWVTWTLCKTLVGYSARRGILPRILKDHLSLFTNIEDDRPSLVAFLSEKEEGLRMDILFVQH